MGFKVGDWVRRKKAHRGGLWRTGGTPYQVKALDEDGDFWDGPQCWVAARFEPIDSPLMLTRKQRDTALAMALTLARLIAPVATSRVVLYHEARLADWLRDCVRRDLEAQP